MASAFEKLIEELQKVGAAIIYCRWHYTPNTGFAVQFSFPIGMSTQQQDHVVVTAVRSLLTPMMFEKHEDIEDNLFLFSQKGSNTNTYFATSNKENRPYPPMFLDAALHILAEWANMRYNEHSMLVWTD